ncbi:MAG TPA: DMT family transporter [Thermoanaerobaculia bacterium]|nr:DMT family transporter [Thermoanaerobaculia bacterium]
MTRPSENPAWEAHLALVGAQVGFALYPIFGKIALATIGPLPFAAFRVVAAAALLALLRRLSGAERVAPEDRKRILLYALLGISFNQVFYILGLSLTTAINATILNSMIPVYTLAAAALLKHERLTARAVLALVVAGAGALLLLRTERFDWSSNAFRGDLLLIANGISYAFYLVLSRPILARYRVLTVVSAIFAYGTLPILIAAAPALAAFDPSRVTPAGWASVAAIIVFSTVLPYFWNSWALARMHASRVAFYAFLQPLISTVLAVETLGERLTLRTAAASLLILSGLGVSLSPGRLPARPIP